MGDGSLENRLFELETRLVPQAETMASPRESEWHHVAADLGSSDWVQLKAFVAYHRIVLLFCGMAALVFGVLSVVGVASGIPAAGLLMFVPLICVVRVAELVYSSFGIVARGNDLTILENPDDVTQCLIEVRYSLQGKPLGADRGVAWFANDALCFNGFRSSFVIGSQDLSSLGKGGRVCLGHPAGVYVIDVRPLVFQSDSRKQSVALFEDNLKQFLRSGVPTSS